MESLFANINVQDFRSLGEGDLDLSLEQPKHLVLMARVVQGNKAVVGATVTAFVNRLKVKHIYHKIA